MTKKIRWYKRNTNEALVGMMPLTLEERGAYNTILDLIYDNDGRLPDDDALVCGWMRCTRRVWHRLRAQLIELGKISVVEGFIRNGRADDELAKFDESLDETSPKLSQNSKANSRKNNELPDRVAPQNQEPRTKNARSATESLPDTSSSLSAQAVEKNHEGGSDVADRRVAGMRRVGDLTAGAPPGRYSSQQERDQWAYQRLAQLVGWDVVMAAEDESDARHLQACRQMRAAAKQHHIGWVSPSRRKARAA